MKKHISLLALLCFTFGIAQAQLQDNYDISVSPNGVIAMPYTSGNFSTFVKYTKIQAPNGQAIHIMAQDAITDAQIVRARNILQFYLTDYAGSQYGANKTAVVNAMGTNNGMLMLLNGSDGSVTPPDIAAQPLYQNEMAVEGHAWYINNDYGHRDASFEEILHFVHDQGIGIDENGTPSPTGALPAYQAEIRAAQQNAILNNFAIWPIGSSATSGWYFELAQENSLSQEYLASVVDSYYGLWEAWIENDNPSSANTGMWGLYISKTRAEEQSEDPMGYALMPKFFSPYININMDIDPSFNGVFNMNYTKAQPYTYKSQYLQHLTLTGNNASGIKGNGLDNKLNGNAANNTLEGGKGDDILDGKAGTDTAIFIGNKVDYIISKKVSHYEVKDKVANRDATDKVFNCEFLKFADQTVMVSTLGVSEVTQDKVQVYPNPITDKVHVQLSTEQAVLVSLFNLKGNQLMSQEAKGPVVDLSTAHLAKGVYMLRIQDHNANLLSTHKLVKL